MGPFTTPTKVLHEDIQIDLLPLEFVAEVTVVSMQVKEKESVSFN